MSAKGEIIKKTRTPAEIGSYDIHKLSRSNGTITKEIIGHVTIRKNINRDSVLNRELLLECGFNTGQSWFYRVQNLIESSVESS